MRRSLWITTPRYPGRCRRFSSDDFPVVPVDRLSALNTMKVIKRFLKNMEFHFLFDQDEIIQWMEA